MATFSKSSTHRSHLKSEAVCVIACNFFGRETGQRVELHQHHKAVGIRRHNAHRATTVIGLNRLDPFRLVALEISGACQSTVRLTVFANRACDAALVERPAAVFGNFTNGLGKYRLADNFARFHRHSTRHVNR